MKIFAERLLELRLDRDLSQAALARALGVSFGIISYWETNRSEPTCSNLLKIADFFDVSADYLLGRKE